MRLYSIMNEYPPIGKTIEELRTQIDQVDNDLVTLISRRAELARAVGALKDANDAITFVPARERAVLAKVEANNKGLLPNEALRGIFQQIIASCRNLEQPVTVAYLGPEYTNTHVAALSRFGTTGRYLAAESIGDIIDLVEHGKAHYGVAPIENSTEGVVRETLDALYRSTLNIADELNMSIRHALYGKGKLEDVTEIYSHPQALAQCRQWLHRCMPNAITIATSSTSQAAMMVKICPKAAAICQQLAAEQAGLNLLADRIEDSAYNRTRFCVVGPAMSQPSGHDKTSIVFSVKHIAGSLNMALAVLQNRGINLTMIESRPTKEMPWQYLFYIDLQGHVNDPNVTAAIEDMREHCLFLRVFGSYPEAN